MLPYLIIFFQRRVSGLPRLHLFSSRVFYETLLMSIAACAYLCVPRYPCWIAGAVALGDDHEGTKHVDAGVSEGLRVRHRLRPPDSEPQAERFPGECVVDSDCLNTPVVAVLSWQDIEPGSHVKRFRAVFDMYGNRACTDFSIF